MPEIVCSIPCVCILLRIPAQSLWIPHGVHQDSAYWLLQFHQVQSPATIHSTYNPCGLHVDSMRSGVEWRTLEKDWKWTGGGLQVDSMDYIWTGGGLHKDPWGSVRYRPCPGFWPWHCLNVLPYLCFDIVLSLSPCPGFWPWHCLKCASLSWIFALTFYWVCLLVLDFGLDIAEMCFLILDLCFNILLSLPSCSGF